jgi:16S rRNA (cytidine1402-2'-O)-methyltransferase
MVTESTVYLIPCFLDETALEVLPANILETVLKCQVVFAENERSARRYLKQLDRAIVIDDFEWFGINKAEKEQIDNFRQKIMEGKQIAIISEAGCPGIADPGQILIAEAQVLGVKVKPLVGPSSVLLALMASGLNGQAFKFNGYLPIDSNDRQKKIRDLEEDSLKQNCTQIFIETPYRNNQMAEAILKTCKPQTKLCIAAELTSANEFIQTKTVAQWKNSLPELHKKPVIFLLLAI